MGKGCEDILIGVVTPTYKRPRLLARFIRRLQKQTFQNWSAVIVHDGPNEELKKLVGKYAKDRRIYFLFTEERANNCGLTPRLEGVKFLQNQANVPDYVVFWDDDNYFHSNALDEIARRALSCGKPDLFLVGMEYCGRVLPPRGASCETLGPGQIDTGTFVVKPGLALKAHRAVIEQTSNHDRSKLLVSDFLTFAAMRSEQQEFPICPDIVVGFHDGLRWKPYIRRMLGLGPLDLGSRSWVRTLTLGKYAQRSAGGLD